MRGSRVEPALAPVGVVAEARGLAAEVILELAAVLDRAGVTKAVEMLVGRARVLLR